MDRIWQAGVAFAVAALIAGSDTSLAQTSNAPDQPPAPAKPKKAQAKKKTPAEAAAAKAEQASSQQSLEAGLAFYQAGRLDAAVAQISTALSGGKLPPSQMAKALYVRGSAQLKLSKFALAISDLTSALWLKGGLNETDRADAMVKRQAAYREAGLPDQTDGSAPPSQTAAIDKAPEGPSRQTASTAGGVVQTKGPVLSAVPQQPSTPETSSGSGFGNFFSNMFGGSSSAAAAEPQVAKPAVQAEPQTSAWAQGTETHASKAAKATAVAKAAPVTVAAAPEPPTEARSMIEVASVRSRDEAQAITQKLQQSFPDIVSAHPPSISEAVVGNFGKLYSVRLGAFDVAKIPRDLCGKFRGAGLDCKVVTN